MRPSSSWSPASPRLPRGSVSACPTRFEVAAVRNGVQRRLARSSRRPLEVTRSIRSKAGGDLRDTRPHARDIRARQLGSILQSTNATAPRLRVTHVKQSRRWDGPSVGTCLSELSVGGSKNDASHNLGPAVSAAGNVSESQETVPYIAPGPCVVELRDVLVRRLPAEGTNAMPQLLYEDGRWRISDSETR